MDTRDRAALGLVAVSVAVAVFAIGGAPRWAALASSALGLACAAPYVTSRRTWPWREPLVLLFLVALGLCLLQVVPLPAVLVGLVSPLRLEHANDAARVLGRPGPTWVALSASPPSTLIESAKLVGYVGVAVACCRLGARRRTARLLAVTVLGTAIAAAAVAWIHELASVSRFFGVYTPAHGSSSPLRSPFVNPNHFASLLALALPLTAGCARASRDPRARAAWAAGLILLAGTVLAVGSRGGALAATAGILVFAAIVWRQDRDGAAADVDAETKVAGALGLVGVAALLWAMFGTRVGTDLAGTSLAEFADANSKFGAWRSALHLLADYPWTGIGRGAFETVFTAYHGPSADRTYAFVENEPLQLVLDFGIPGALVLAGLGFLVARRSWSGAARSPVRAGAAAGVAAVLLHNLVDFSLELPGVAVPTIVAAGLTLRSHANSTSTSKLQRLGGRLAAGALGVLILVLAARSQSLYEDRAELRTTLAATHSVEKVQRALRRHVERHPYDYLAYGLSAQALTDLRSGSAARALNRALRLHPTLPALRRVEGELLYAAGYPEQAARAFARALERRLDGRLLASVIDRFATDSLLLRALPRQNRPDRVIASLLARDRAAAASAYATEVIATGNAPAGLLAQAGAAALAVGDRPSGLARLEQAFERAPTPDLADQLARALLADGAPARAWEIAQTGLRGVTNTSRDRASLRWIAADAQLQSGAPDRARAELEAAVREADSSSLEIRARRRLADFEDRLGNAHAAEFQRSQIRRMKTLNSL